MSLFDDELEKTKTELRESIKTALSASFNAIVEEAKDAKYGEKSKSENEDDENEDDDDDESEDDENEKDKSEKLK